MLVIQSTSLDPYQPGKQVSWKEESKWSGVIMERKGFITGISQTPQGCYIVTLDNDRYFILELI